MNKSRSNSNKTLAKKIKFSSEKEFLNQSIQWTENEIQTCSKELLKTMGRLSDPTTWIKSFPWETTSAVAVLGFVGVVGEQTHYSKSSPSPTVQSPPLFKAGVDFLTGTLSPLLSEYVRQKMHPHS